MDKVSHVVDEAIDFIQAMVKVKDGVSGYGYTGIMELKYHIVPEHPASVDSMLVRLKTWREEFGG